MWSRASRHVAQMTQNYVSPVPDKIQEALRVLFHNRFGF
jgi:hypothetical protein